MNSIIAGLKIVPGTAWIVGCLLAILSGLAIALGPLTYDTALHTIPMAMKWGLLLAPPLCVMIYALLVGFIYVDAKRRQMRHVMWAWLALVPYLVGVILYFILRDPLPTPCPVCGSDVLRRHAFCAGCGASVHPTCNECGKSLELGWSNCPFCGYRVNPPEPASS